MNSLRRCHLEALAALTLSVIAHAADEIQFNRDVRPILSEKCLRCHGPDKSQRKAELRLDVESAIAGDGKKPGVIVRGDPQASDLFRRVVSTDPDQHMPPPDSGHKLTAQQIDLLRRWIQQGAKWEGHWAFLPPRRAALPEVRTARFVTRNAIDRFVVNRLEREGLVPSPEAARTTLIRRVTLDLTGLPPTSAEVAAFLADESPDAYERLVDRLLSSPRYGERMTIRWLDAARYADTSGYQNDGPRQMWRWRDWVIDALNADMPFDQFTIEQLAGDLLPNATREQRIATGFNRNHRGNAEGGIIPEEYAVEYVVDRVDTTATVWLGLTLGCARCHDHKFDPISQREFYQLFAYFNNISEHGRAIKEGNSPPYIQAPTPIQERKLAALDAAIERAESRVVELEPELLANQRSWEADIDNRDGHSSQNDRWSLTDGLVKSITFDEPIDHPPAMLLAGVVGNAAQLDGQQVWRVGDVGNFGYFDKFTIAAWIRPDDIQRGTIVSRMTDTPRGDGYYLQLAAGKLQVNLVKRWLDDALRVETVAAIAANRWQHVVVTYDGTRTASAVNVFIDGQRQAMTTLLDGLNQTFSTKEPLRIGGGGGPEAMFRGQVDEVNLFGRALSPDEAAILAVPESPVSIAAMPREKRTPIQEKKLRAFFLNQLAPESIRAAHRQLLALHRERRRFVELLPTVMVMQELPTSRETPVLQRGEYDKPGPLVQRGTPGCFPPLPNNQPNDRLALARWLVTPSHPLTARVAVNRAWQLFFGMGLVRTTEDFGSQGQLPSHPELLDWLATEFSHEWSLKQLHRCIVTSATYRQSSSATVEQWQRDPENRLLARGPRFRLPAEMIRDQALAVSGLLDGRVGGPSVKPYQPADLWKELATDNLYEQSHGPDLYRRGMYTYWKRTVAPPTLVTFDAGGREACNIRDSRTNTPLQALTLLNETAFVEAARRFAERIINAGGATPELRLAFAFRELLAREPQDAEQRRLLTSLQEYLAQFHANESATRALVRIGEAPRDTRLSEPELAAYTTLASVLLNLDEAVTKE